VGEPEPKRLKIEVPASDEERQEAKDRILDEHGIDGETLYQEPERPEVEDDFGRRMKDPSRFGGGRG
jgi:hypothetical protein